MLRPSALKAKGYAYRYVFAEAVGHSFKVVRLLSFR